MRVEGLVVSDCEARNALTGKLAQMQETQGACEVQRIVASGDRSFNPTRIKTLTIKDRVAFYQQVLLGSICSDP